MNEPILLIFGIPAIFGFVFAMGFWASEIQYHHDTREGTIVCEGAESIIYDEKIYCLNKDNGQTHLNDTDIK